MKFKYLKLPVRFLKTVASTLLLLSNFDNLTPYSIDVFTELQLNILNFSKTSLA